MLFGTFLSLLFLTLPGGCGDEGDPAHPAGPGDGDDAPAYYGIEMTVAGGGAPGAVAWSDLQTTVLREEDGFRLNAGSGTGITFALRLPLVPGVYPVSSSGTSVVQVVYLEGDSPLKDPEGSVSISGAFQSAIQGSFSITGLVGYVPHTWGRVITGTFDVRIDATSP